MVYSELVIKCRLQKLVKNTGEGHMIVVNKWIVVVCVIGVCVP